MSRARLLVLVPCAWALWLLVQLPPTVAAQSRAPSGQVAAACLAERTVVLPGGTTRLRGWASLGDRDSTAPALRWTTRAGTIAQGDAPVWTLPRRIGKYSARLVVGAPSKPLVSCTVSVHVVAQLPVPWTGSLKGDYRTCRELLPSGSEPQRGYGAYTFLLFAKKPANEQETARYRAVIGDYLYQLDALSIAARKQSLSKRNLTMIPVTDELDLPAANISAEDARRLSGDVLGLYDYERARDLLVEHGYQQLDRGPYLLTVFPTANKKLFQDLSGGSAVLAANWVATFGYLTVQEPTWARQAWLGLSVGMREFVRGMGKSAEELSKLVVLSDWR